MTRTEKKEQEIALKAYDRIMRYALDTYTKESAGSKSGSMYAAQADFRYGMEDHTIMVKYGYTPTNNYIESLLRGDIDWYSETGNLSKMYISESCGVKGEENYYPVSIRGRWTPKDSGGGDLIIVFSKDGVLSVIIFGDGNWKHWADYTVKEKTFIVDVFNDALLEKSKLNKTEYNPILPDALLSGLGSSSVQTPKTSPLEVLKVIYPNRQGDGEPEDFTEYKTERFYWYERIESDFDVLWQTQDGYTYVEKPNPAFTPYPGIDNAYIVEWTQSEGAGRTRVGLVFVNQDGKWLVDNAWPVGEDASAEPKMYFDYSKVPEHWASDDAMDDEERAFVRKVKKMLGQ